MADKTIGGCVRTPYPDAFCRNDWTRNLYWLKLCVHPFGHYVDHQGREASTICIWFYLIIISTKLFKLKCIVKVDILYSINYVIFIISDDSYYLLFLIISFRLTGLIANRWPFHLSFNGFYTKAQPTSSFIGLHLWIHKL